MAFACSDRLCQNGNDAMTLIPPCYETYDSVKGTARLAGGETMTAKQKPVAWAIEWIGTSSIDGIDLRCVFHDKKRAETHVGNCTQPYRVVPLYTQPQPIITETELHANAEAEIKCLKSRLCSTAVEMRRIADSLESICQPEVK